MTMADKTTSDHSEAGQAGAPEVPWPDDLDLVHYAAGSRIHLVGCGVVGGEYVSAIIQEPDQGPEGLVAYTFQMEPAIEEDYRQLRRQRAAVAEGGGPAPAQGGQTQSGGEGIVRRLGRMFGFGRGTKPPEGAAAQGTPPTASVLPGDPSRISEFEAMVQAISGSIKDADLIILVCGMDDPEGFEAARVFAEVAKERDILSFCYVFLPHGFDNVDGVHRANRDLQRLRLIVDIVAVLPNQVHMGAGDLAPIIKETVEVTTTAGLVNVDVADLKSTVRGGNVALIGIGEAGGEGRLAEAVKRALSHRLMLIDYAAVNKAVVNITGGEDMTIDEAEGASRWVAKNIKKDARMVWGAEIEKEMEGRLRVFVMAAATPVEVLLYIYTSE